MMTKSVEFSNEQIRLLRYAVDKANFFYVQRAGRDLKFESNMEKVELILKELEQ